jgi:sugar/nucleoside kinase (ribokinase family)
MVFSDFRHGMFNKQIIDKCIDIAKQQRKVIIADTQVSNRWGNIADYKGIDLVCPNEAEARFALGKQDIGVLPLGRELLKETGGDNLILKLGERGIIAFEKPPVSKDPNKVRDYYPIHSFKRQFVDAVGAGDALLAAASLSMSKGNHLLAVSILANAAAALSLERMGNIPIKYDDLRDFVENNLLKEIFV